MVLLHCIHELSKSEFCYTNGSEESFIYFEVFIVLIYFEEISFLQALYHREVARHNNNNNSTTSRNGELDPEVTLQFLKSAIYYFLTDKDNSRGHLRAIESILGYTDSERYNIDKVVK